jgi:NTP pyrophosphatase (non-canonical NTP hydrolase)
VNANEPPPPAAPTAASAANVSLDDLQALIRRMYFEKDQARGLEGTFMWFMEEVGELAAALRSGTHEERLGEFADVLAWLTTLANVAGIRLSDAVTLKYGAGCPGCGQFACQCAMSGKP